jgi:hypothetical protein
MSRKQPQGSPPDGMVKPPPPPAPPPFRHALPRMSDAEFVAEGLLRYGNKFCLVLQELAPFRKAG